MDDEKKKELAAATAAAIAEGKNKAVLDVVEAALAEADRRARGEFDGLLGSLPEGGSLLLSDILDELRGVLLERFSDNEARDLLDKYRSAIDLHGPMRIPSVPSDVELALRLLTLIASATACEGEQFAKIVLGTAGARDARQQVKRAEGVILSRQARAKAADLRHQEWIQRAKLMKESGTSTHDLASKVANYFRPLTAAAVRPVLQQAGVLPRKKRK